MKRTLVTLLALTSTLAAADHIPNPQIDYPGFQRLVGEMASKRESRRLSEAQFAALAKDPGTIVLDARSADKYALRHLTGAVSLPFTDFTAASLAALIPAKTTRLLIYCNNNFTGAPVSLATKAFPASLNIATYVALATYGYTNVYELGPVLDVATTKLEFTGTETDHAVIIDRNLQLQQPSGIVFIPDAALLDCSGRLSLPQQQKPAPSATPAPYELKLSVK